LSEEVYERAVAAAERAYAPYSNYLVGAAVQARDGRVFEGVNVENAAYPLGVCAEKVAISCAVVAGCRPGDLEAIGITASPCGGCRQWLYEFRLERVTFRNRRGRRRQLHTGGAPARHLGAGLTRAAAWPGPRQKFHIRHERVTDTCAGPGYRHRRGRRATCPTQEGGGAGS